LVTSNRPIEPSKIGASCSRTTPPLPLSSIASFIGADSSSSRERVTGSRRPLSGYPNTDPKVRMKKEIVWTFPLNSSNLNPVARVGHFEVAIGDNTTKSFERYFYSDDLRELTALQCRIRVARSWQRHLEMLSYLI
jgi:hypothetical protein